MTELERCLALLKEIDHKAAKREIPFRFGTAYLHDELPNVWSRNYLSLERELESATPGLVSAEADRVLGEAGITHRKVEVFDAERRRAARSRARQARLAGRVRRRDGRGQRA